MHFSVCRDPRAIPVIPRRAADVVGDGRFVWAEASNNVLSVADGTCVQK